MSGSTKGWLLISVTSERMGYTQLNPPKSLLSNSFIKKTDPGAGLDQTFLLKEFKAVMQEDSLLSTHPVNRPLVDPSQIGWVFNGISYKKGASILHMLAEFLGMQTFRRALKRYLKAKYFNIDHPSFSKI